MGAVTSRGRGSGIGISQDCGMSKVRWCHPACVMKDCTAGAGNVRLIRWTGAGSVLIETAGTVSAQFTTEDSKNKNCWEKTAEKSNI